MQLIELPIMQLCTLLLLLLPLVAARKEDDLPEFFKVCHRSDPELEECIVRSVETLRPYLKKGIPELKIPRCEPLIIPEFILTQGKGAISMTSTYRNISVTGAAGFRLDRIRVDFQNNRVQIQLFIPQLQTKSNYTMTGRIMILPLSGQGISHSNYSEITATCTMQGKEVLKRGQVHWVIDDVFLALDIGNASIQVDGMFSRDRELGVTLNRFLNDNWQSVAEEIKPSLEAKLADKFKDIANHIFGKFPMDVLLPP